MDRLSLYDWLLLFEHLRVRCCTKCFTCVALYKLTIQNKNDLGCRMANDLSQHSRCAPSFLERGRGERRGGRGDTSFFLINKNLSLILIGLT